MGPGPDHRHHGLQLRPARPEQVRLDAQRRGLRDPDEPLPRRRRRRRGHRGRRLQPNDVAGDGANSFQVQHPDDHLYASSTGSVWDCPQPDLGLLPGTPTDWTPDPVDTTEPVLTCRPPRTARRPRRHLLRGAARSSGDRSTRRRRRPPRRTTTPTATRSHRPVTTSSSVEVEVTDLEVTATLSRSPSCGRQRRRPACRSTASASTAARSSRSCPTRDSPAEVIDHGPLHGADRCPASGRSGTRSANTVTFHIPRSYLAGAKVTAPYDVFAPERLHRQHKLTVVTDDRAPDAGSIGVAAPAGTTSGSPRPPRPRGSGGSAAGSTAGHDRARAARRQHASPALDTSLGVTAGTQDQFTLVGARGERRGAAPRWGDSSDLDMSVTGAASGSAASAGQPERLRARERDGHARHRGRPLPGPRRAEHDVHPHRHPGRRGRRQRR